jgi:hypothetical protein
VIGKTCADRNDCFSARCGTGTCQDCISGHECGSDANGECDCRGDRGESCVTQTARAKVPTCDDCPPNWGCAGGGGQELVSCYPPCGSSEICGVADACKVDKGTCGRGGKCFQPHGGGPTRCGAPTVTGSCGCTSDQECVANHGSGAFCVEITGGLCTGCAAGTFCATPR